MIKSHFRLSALLALFAALALACGQTFAMSAQEINIKVDETLKKFETEGNGGKTFLQKAEGVLVFPEVIKAGIGIIVENDVS